ncbi:MAG: AI-2E family transporter [Chitinivibrionales bacterium]|nr:AI-2E family transporter [Chitinivibrionales bacterium]
MQRRAARALPFEGLMRVSLILKIAFFVLAAGVCAAIVYCLYLLRIPLIMSITLAFLLKPLVNFGEMHGLNRTVVIVGLFLGIGLAAALAVMVVGPLLVGETGIFMHNLPRYAALMRQTLDTAHQTLVKLFPSVNVPDLYVFFKGKFVNELIGFVKALPGVISSFAGFLPTLLIVPFIAYFLLADGHLIQKALLALVPNRYFEMFALLINKVIVALQLFIRGQMLDSLSVGTLMALGLTIVGIPYGIVIGIIAAIGNLIPYFGPLIGLTPAVLVVLLGPPASVAPSLLAIAIVFAGVQIIESTLVYPLAMGRSVNLHPLVVIIGVTAGGQIGGIIGMIVAIPLISIFKVSLETLHFYLKSYSII